MCLDCAVRWVCDLDDDEDWPEVIPWPPMTDAMRQLVEQINRLYEMPNCGVGGPLHVVTDDFNVEDHCLDACERLLTDPEPWYGTDEAMVALTRTIIAGMRRLTLGQRGTVLAVKWDELDVEALARG